MPNIHPTAIIHDDARIADTARIGPYCVVGQQVVLGDAVELKSHVVVEGDTEIGNNTVVYPFASIGHIPQDLKFKGEASRLIIGSYNTIREHVTMNPGTEGGGLVTRVGNHCLFMIGSHVAHDCMVGDHVILANNATLAGHVEVGDGAIIGGLSAIHQFVRIGRYAMIGGMSGVDKDVIPFGSVMGERADLSGLNLIGLKRRNIDRDVIHELRGLYKSLFEQESGVLEERIAQAQSDIQSAEAKELISFLTEDSSRSFCMPRMRAA